MDIPVVDVLNELDDIPPLFPARPDAASMAD